MNNKYLGFVDSDETEQITKEDFQIFLSTAEEVLRNLYFSIPSSVRGILEGTANILR